MKVQNQLEKLAKNLKLFRVTYAHIAFCLLLDYLLKPDWLFFLWVAGERLSNFVAKKLLRCYK